MATKQKATTISTIEDLLKMGRITRFTSEAEKVPAISTGSLMLDKAVGIGGLPLGRIVEIYGSESAGKSTLCQHVIANAQKTGYGCLYIDMEHGLDPEYMQRIGVDLEKVYIAQPNTGEDALELVGAFILGGGKVVVVDSVSALIPRAELEGDMGDANVGLQARLMSQAMRKLGGLIKTNNALVIFTNQIRMKIGVMYASPETTSGGNALKFYASVRIDCRIAERNPDGSVKIRATVKKNKVGPPAQKAEYVITNDGIDLGRDLIQMGVNLGFITKKGGWLEWNGVKENGDANFLAKIDIEELNALVRKELGL